MHWLAQGLKKVKFRWNQVSLWQHKILREISFYICIEKEKKITLVCFLLPLKREIKKCLTLAAYLLHLETPGLPACYPLIPLFSFRRIMLPRERGILPKLVRKHIFLTLILRVSDTGAPSSS